MVVIRVICIVVALVVSHGVLAQSKKEVLQVQASRFKAMIEVDITGLENILADDLTYTHTTGTTESKAEFLSVLRSHELEYKSIKPRDSDVRLYGSTALVTGISDMLVISDGKQLALAIRFIEVYLKSDNSWQLVAWQSTRLPD